MELKLQARMEEMEKRTKRFATKPWNPNAFTIILLNTESV
jgi:hypothetical protein